MIAFLTGHDAAIPVSTTHKFHPRPQEVQPDLILAQGMQTKHIQCQWLLPNITLTLLALNTAANA
jgi:hypothetical protein